jgi:hypothetical protein
MKRYVWNFLISLDQLLNTILGGNPDETMSSRMGKCIEKNNCKFCGFVCKILNLFEKDHCYKSIERDEI